MSRFRSAALVLAAAAVATSLSGCATTVTIKPADDANNPLCADVSVRLPGTVAGLDRRWTDAQATGAWGEPSAVLLTCGVAPPGPTTLPCQSVDGVDWIIDDSDAPRYRFTTYGRTPAVEVYLDYDVVSGNDALQKLSPIIGQLPVDAECVAREDATPAP
ncbi:MAG TPA: DUF3515 domain-containing protein [Microbacterium sp.]|uniref:DUF3515 domain-containing protein n=1 Tax=Microbacterium sp. TaxID=51671 RepID=UPI002BF7703B|nr:DUF3515 domain-containing protein [Microbacterium sp.]HWI30517.1 DUF3515 domain-containing protein [Microbacterium sp.]